MLLMIDAMKTIKVKIFIALFSDGLYNVFESRESFRSPFLSALEDIS